jgi:hypothetical protein
VCVMMSGSWAAGKRERWSLGVMGFVNRFHLAVTATVARRIGADSHYPCVLRAAASIRASRFFVESAAR